MVPGEPQVPGVPEVLTEETPRKPGCCTLNINTPYIPYPNLTTFELYPQHGTLRHSTVQHSTAPHSAARHTAASRCIENEHRETGCARLLTQQTPHTQVCRKDPNTSGTTVCHSHQSPTLPQDELRLRARRSTLAPPPSGRCLVSVLDHGSPPRRTSPLHLVWTRWEMQRHHKHSSGSFSEK